MHRAMLNMLPSWIFILLFVVGLCAAVALFFLTIRRFLPQYISDENNKILSSLLGITGTLYGFLLSLVIVIVWQNYNQAKFVTLAEANNFSIILNSLGAFAPDAQVKVIDGIQDYMSLLKNEEWEAMRWGRSSPDAWPVIQNLYDTLRTIDPVTEVQKIFYRDIVTQLDSIVQNRSSRILAAETILPSFLMFLLILGGLIVTFALTLFKSKHRAVHLGSLIIASSFIALSTASAFILAHPFSGDFGISGKPLFDDIPARIADLQPMMQDATASPQPEVPATPPKIDVPQIPAQAETSPTPPLAESQQQVAPQLEVPQAPPPQPAPAQPQSELPQADAAPVPPQPETPQPETPQPETPQPETPQPEAAMAPPQGQAQPTAAQQEETDILSQLEGAQNRAQSEGTGTTDQQSEGTETPSQAETPSVPPRG